jgi:hypothetical protein
VKQGGASCIAWTRRKTGAQKLSAALIFFGYFFLSRKKSNIVFNNFD